MGGAYSCRIAADWPVSGSALAHQREPQGNNRQEADTGSADPDKFSAEALTLGQALGVSDRELSELFAARGFYLNVTNRRPEAAPY